MIHRARETQGGIAKITTMEEFAKTMLDPSRKIYKTHCLMMFVSNKSAEKMGEEVYHFPYPFAGEVGQRNSYSTLLQVAKASICLGVVVSLEWDNSSYVIKMYLLYFIIYSQIRFNSQTDLTRLFGAKSNSNTPHIIFARKGDALNNIQVFNPERRKRAGIDDDIYNEFKKWVESLHFIHVTVANLHSLPLDLFIMRNGHVIHRDHSLSPGYQQSYLSLHAGDRIFAFDERLDRFPGATRFNDKIANTKGVLILDVVVGTSFENTYRIKTRRCYDLSTQCHDWAVTPRGMNTGQCNLNPEFMHHICPFSCGVCSEWLTSDISYLAFHRPIHTFPALIRGGVRAGRSLMHDIGFISRLRKNAAAVFFAFGLLVAFSNVLCRSATAATSTSPIEQLRQESKLDLISVPDQRLNFALDSISILMVATIFAAFTWLTSTPVNGVPPWLRGIRGDLIGVSSFLDIFILLLTAGLIAGAFTPSIIRCIKGIDLDAESLMFLIFAILTLVGATFTVLAVVMSYNTLLLVQWRHLRRYHKNAASMVVIFGAFAGVGLVSLHRLAKPLRKQLEGSVTRLSFPAVLSNIMILAAVCSVALWDPHFKADIMHVLKSSTNAAIAFAVFGLVTGHFVVKLLM